MRLFFLALLCLVACTTPRFSWKALSPEARKLGENERDQQSLLLALWLSGDAPFAASGTLRLKSLLLDEQLSFLLFAGDEDAFRLEAHSFGRPALIVTVAKGQFQAELPLEHRTLSGPVDQVPKMPLLHLGLGRLRNLLSARPPVEAYSDMTFLSLGPGQDGTSMLVLAKLAKDGRVEEEVVLDPENKRLLSWSIGPETALIHCRYARHDKDGHPRLLDIEDREQGARYTLTIEQLVVGPLDESLFVPISVKQQEIKGISGNQGGGDGK